MHDEHTGGPATPGRGRGAAEALAERVARCRARRTVACAESFTAGSVSRALAAAEGSSDWFRGGVVAYQKRTKFAVLGVQPGPVVTETAAVQMARGVARLMDADAAVATTGCAGPGGMDGRPVGTVVIGWWVDDEGGARTYHLDGPPEQVVRDGAAVALGRLADVLDGRPVPAGVGPRAVDPSR